jgi:hypothetical protein
MASVKWVNHNHVVTGKIGEGEWIPDTRLKFIPGRFSSPNCKHKHHVQCSGRFRITHVGFFQCTCSCHREFKDES